MAKRIYTDEQLERKKAYAKAWHQENAEKVRANVKAWRLANPEKKKKNDRKWHEANFEKEKARKKAWALANAEKEKARKKAYREANPEKVKEATLAWQKANPERVKYNTSLWQKTNREARRRIDSTRRAREKGNGGELSKDIIQRLIVSQKGLCVYCHVDLNETKYHLDHIMPLAKGGLNSDENVQLLCPTCNLQKGAKDPIEFAKSKGLLV